MAKNIIQIKNVTFSYQQKPIWKNLSLTIAPNSCSVLCGASGSGKSTLLKLLAGLYPKYQGQISTGKVIVNMTRAMMFQDPSQQFAMATPREEIIFSLENLKLSRACYQQRLKRAVQFTEAENILDRKFTTLSGGEKQRAALAVLLAMDSQLLLLDEPFASVDPAARAFLIAKLIQLKKMGKTIIISDHLLTGYQDLADHLLESRDGKIISRDITILKKQNNETSYHFALPDKQGAAFTFSNYSISRQNHILIKQKHLIIPRHQTTLLTGANGSGKSSLLKSLSKLLPYQGSIKFQGQEIAKLNTRRYLRQVGLVFQDANDQFLTITAEDEIALSLKHSDWDENQTRKWLKRLNLAASLKQPVYTLSGGQKKKLQLLLMLMAGQETLLIDEPLSGLDQDSVAAVVQLLKRQQKTLIIISHQLEGLAQLCDFHLQLKGGKLSYVTD